MIFVIRFFLTGKAKKDSLYHRPTTLEEEKKNGRYHFCHLGRSVRCRACFSFGVEDPLAPAGTSDDSDDWCSERVRRASLH